MMRKPALLIVFALLVSGCATTCLNRPEFAAQRPSECRTFLERLDEVVEKTGTRDASTAPVPCFPYLRTNRFLEAAKTNIDTMEARDYWLFWMQELDLKAREKEIANLPDEAVLSLIPNLDGKADREGLFDRVITCSYKLLDFDELLPYEVLESLADEQGNQVSIFDCKGIAKGSGRIQPYILFSAGIPSVGSMRQRGNHPITLTGRNHFDDPHLFEKNFIFNVGRQH